MTPGSCPRSRRPRGHLRLEEHVDLRVLHDARDALVDDVAGRVQVRRREIDVRDLAAEMIGALDEVDAPAGIGEVQGRRHAGDAAADDEAVGAHVDRHALQGLLPDHAVDAAAVTRSLAFSVASTRSSCTQEHCSRILAISRK